MNHKFESSVEIEINTHLLLGCKRWMDGWRQIACPTDQGQARAVLDKAIDSNAQTFTPI